MEEWRDIDGYDNRFMVSNTGRVASKDVTLINKDGVRRFWPGKLMKCSVNTQGYVQVTFGVRGKTNVVHVHRLVAKYFCNNSNNYNVVNHIDGNRSNNNYKNLEWCTAAENARHGRASKLNSIEVLSIVNLCNNSVNRRCIASLFGMTTRNISEIMLGDTWKDVTGITRLKL